MVSFRVLAPALLALAGCVVAQDVEQTTSTTTQTESTPTLSTTETLATQTLSSATLSNQTTTSSTQSFSSLTTSGPTTLSQVVLTTTTASTQTVPTPTKSNKKEKPTLFSEYGCQGQNQTVEPDNHCYVFGTDLEEFYAGISVPSGSVCDWYEASNCTEKFWNYMQFPGDCQFGYFARTRARSIKCYRDRRAF